MNNQLKISKKNEGTQSIERALHLLQLVASSGQEGMRLIDIIRATNLHKPTVRRILIALIRSGLLEQDCNDKRYFIGQGAFFLGLAAGARFCIHHLSLGSLMRLAKASSDSVFISVRRNNHAVCFHCEEVDFPIRTQMLKSGNSHPLGIGAGSLAILSALKDAEITTILQQNKPILRAHYPGYDNNIIWRCVEETRLNGYAFNAGILVPGSCGVGVAVRGAQDQPLGAISITAIEKRLNRARREELLPLLHEEAEIISAQLRLQEQYASLNAYQN